MLFSKGPYTCLVQSDHNPGFTWLKAYSFYDFFAELAFFKVVGLDFNGAGYRLDAVIYQPEINIGINIKGQKDRFICPF